MTGPHWPERFGSATDSPSEGPSTVRTTAGATSVHSIDNKRLCISQHQVRWARLGLSRRFLCGESTAVMRQPQRSIRLVAELPLWAFRHFQQCHAPPILQSPLPSPHQTFALGAARGYSRITAMTAALSSWRAAFRVAKSSSASEMKMVTIQGARPSGMTTATMLRV